MTRARSIQLYVSAAVLVAVGAVAAGASITVETAVLLVAMALVPPAIIFAMWPTPEAPTAADIMRNRH